MNRLPQTLILLLAYSFANPVLHAEVRTFTSTAGTSIRGELAGIKGDSVAIKKEDGRTITVKASAFSPADVAWLQTQGLPLEAVFSKTTPFVNSLGMKFVALPGMQVLFCIHETRRMDYTPYAAETPAADSTWKQPKPQNGAPVSFADDHPVVCVNYNDARAYCAWLGQKEGKTYRLPTDREWSIAVGIGGKEAATGLTPADLDSKIKDLYQWGGGWPPPPGSGNFADICYVPGLKAAKGKKTMPDYIIPNYDDGFATTAPVMSFKPNALGIYDLAGNVFESCEDWFDDKKKERVIRSSSWQINKPEHLLSSFRHWGSNARMEGMGFRVVLEQ